MKTNGKEEQKMGKLVNVAEIFGENVFNDTCDAGASAEEDLQGT